MADPDDPTVPTGRAGVDPLIAFPKQSTGETGQIERPGDQTPWWFIPGLCAVAVFFIGLLATINQDRDADRVEAEQQAAAQQAPHDSANVVSDDVSPVPVGPAPSDPASDADAAVAVTVDPRLEELPAPGMVRRDGAEFPISSGCEVQLPFDPADTEYQVSSYFFSGDDGERHLIDRIFDGDRERAQLLDSSPFVELDGIGDTGAFVATFTDAEGNEFDVVVNPAADIAPGCEDRVVTNVPGQFSEPHTWVILDVCVVDPADAFVTVVGLTSEGSRFEILQTGDEFGEIVFVELDAEPKHTTGPASVVRNDDGISVSGVVGDGADDLDIAIDIGTTFTEADARTCVQSDRL